MKKTTSSKKSYKDSKEEDDKSSSYDRASKPSYRPNNRSNGRRYSKPTARRSQNGGSKPKGSSGSKSGSTMPDHDIPYTNQVLKPVITQFLPSFKTERHLVMMTDIGDSYATFLMERIMTLDHAEYAAATGDNFKAYATAGAAEGTQGTGLIFDVMRACQRFKPDNVKTLQEDAAAEYLVMMIYLLVELFEHTWMQSRMPAFITKQATTATNTSIWNKQNYDQMLREVNSLQLPCMKWQIELAIFLTAPFQYSNPDSSVPLPRGIIKYSRPSMSVDKMRLLMAALVKRKGMASIHFAKVGLSFDGMVISDLFAPRIRPIQGQAGIIFRSCLNINTRSINDVTVVAYSIYNPTNTNHFFIWNTEEDDRCPSVYAILPIMGDYDAAKNKYGAYSITTPAAGKTGKICFYQMGLYTNTALADNHAGVQMGLTLCPGAYASKYRINDDIGGAQAEILMLSPHLLMAQSMPGIAFTPSASTYSSATAYKWYQAALINGVNGNSCLEPTRVKEPNKGSGLGRKDDN